jgi:hypothetical protein
VVLVFYIDDCSHNSRFKTPVKTRTTRSSVGLNAEQATGHAAFHSDRQAKPALISFGADPKANARNPVRTPSPTAHCRDNT